MSTHKEARVNCEGCKERCRHSLESPFNTECLYADSIAGTGQKEQLSIRSKIARLTAKLKKTKESGGN